MMRPEQITDVIAFHGEGPVWHSSWGGLRMVDMLAGTILTLSGSGEVTRIATGSRIAAFVRPRERGGYVAGLERGIGLADAPFATPTSLPEMWSDPNVRMNECGLDPWGRLYAGSMPYDRTLGAGRLYRIEADGRYSTALYHVTVSNGLDFAPDGQRAYYNDTSTGCTDVFDVVGGDAEGGGEVGDGVNTGELPDLVGCHLPDPALGQVAGFGQVTIRAPGREDELSQGRDCVGHAFNGASLDAECATSMRWTVTFSLCVYSGQQ
nr:MAG TPA: SMP-30/Gluconolaconase/LRE-like region [Caudoviricetes sp.]